MNIEHVSSYAHQNTYQHVTQSKQDLKSAFNQHYHHAASEEQVKEMQQWLAQKADLSTPEKLQAHLEEQGELQESSALVTINGEAAAFFDKDMGLTQADDSLFMLHLQANGDFDKFTQLVKEQYGEQAEVEKFEQGQGPTNAELYELKNGESYESYVQSEVKALRESTYESQLYLEHAQRQRLLREQSPQDVVFSVNGETVASISDSGYTNTYQNLLKFVDERDISRDEIKSLYTDASKLTKDNVNEILQAIFGDDVNMAEFEGKDRLTFAELKEHDAEYYA